MRRRFDHSSLRPVSVSLATSLRRTVVGRWTRIACLAALMASTAQAQTYTVDVRPDLAGLDIKIEPVAQTGLLVVRLTNATDRKVRCDLRYDASPQPLYRKTTYLDPGKTEQSDFRAKRKWFEVTVEVKCRPVESETGR